MLTGTFGRVVFVSGSQTENRGAKEEQLLPLIVCGVLQEGSTPTKTI